MAKQNARVLLFKLICLTVLFQLTTQRPATEVQMKEVKGSNEGFDFFVFRQIWPVTSCMYPNGHTCVVAKNVTTWVIHGLWPNFFAPEGKTDYPSFCNPNDSFKKELIEPLIPQMTKYW